MATLKSVMLLSPVTQLALNSSSRGLVPVEIDNVNRRITLSFLTADQQLLVQADSTDDHNVHQIQAGRSQYLHPPLMASKVLSNKNMESKMVLNANAASKVDLDENTASIVGRNENAASKVGLHKNVLSKVGLNERTASKVGLNESAASKVRLNENVASPVLSHISVTSQVSRSQGVVGVEARREHVSHLAVPMTVPRECSQASLLPAEGKGNMARMEIREIELPEWARLPGITSHINERTRYGDERTRYGNEGTGHSNEGFRHSKEGARFSNEGARHGKEGTRYCNEGETKPYTNHLIHAEEEVVITLSWNCCCRIR